MSILNKICSLSLNSNWQPVNVRSIGSAIVDLCSSETTGDGSCLALDIEYDLNEDGTPDFDNAKSIRPVSWNEWITLEVRDWDFAVNSPSMVIRAPTVTVAVNYNKMPVKLFRKNPNKEGVRIRDKNRCGYTGQILDRSTYSVDHIIPKSRGGTDDWTNVISCHRDINSKKGNKLNHEIGLKLLKKPSVPRPMAAFETICEEKHVTWRPFLVHNK